jgi:hypothetical protein
MEKMKQLLSSRLKTPLLGTAILMEGLGANMPAQQERQDPPDTRVKRHPQCNLLGCEELALAFLATYSLCLSHFFSGCRAACKRCDELLKNRTSRNVALTKQIVIECEKGARGLTYRTNVLSHHEQSELLELLLRLEAVMRRLRRSVRRMASIPVLLRSDSPENPWEERALTLQLSRYGTALRCVHPVETEQHVSLVRLDTGQETGARVAWTRLSGGQYEIAVEHLGRENFWGWEWTADETYGNDSPIYLDNTRGQGALDLILANVEDKEQPQRRARHAGGRSPDPHSKSRRVRGRQPAK